MRCSVFAHAVYMRYAVFVAHAVFVFVHAQGLTPLCALGGCRQLPLAVITGASRSFVVVIPSRGQWPWRALRFALCAATASTRGPTTTRRVADAEQVRRELQHCGRFEFLESRSPHAVQCTANRLLCVVLVPKERRSAERQEKSAGQRHCSSFRWSLSWRWGDRGGRVRAFTGGRTPR
jgi:hypothetical protein